METRSPMPKQEFMLRYGVRLKGMMLDMLTNGAKGGDLHTKIALLNRMAEELLSGVYKDLVEDRIPVGGQPPTPAPTTPKPADRQQAGNNRPGGR